MAQKKKATARKGAGRAKAARKTERAPNRSSRKATRKTAKRSRAKARPATRDLLGPPPAEAILIRDDREREATERLREHTATSPELSGGDVDADWQRAASVGEEAVGGTVATPDQDVVDDLGKALGVPRAPDEAFRTSQEILESRDARRVQQEG